MLRSKFDCRLLGSIRRTDIHLTPSEQVDERTPIPPPDWEALISQIADDIIAEHTPARILQVRAKLYDLLTHCIPASVILKTLAFKLMTRIDDDLKAEVIKWAAFYEHRIRNGTVSWRCLSLICIYELLTSVQKVIFHLEAFVAKVMRILEG